MGSLSFRQLFALLFVSFCALFVSSYLAAWTGPTASPPGNNVSAPINVGTASQIKDGVIGVDGLAVFGTAYVQDRFGVGVVSPVVAIETPGTLKIGSGGEVCQAVTEGAIRYNTTSNQIEVCNGLSWTALGGTKYLNVAFVDASNTSTGSFTMPETANGLLTVYANVCVPNAQATVVTLTVDGVTQNTAYHRDAANSGGVTCTIETLTYHGTFSAGSHTVAVSLSGSGRVSSAYSTTRDPAVQAHVLYPVN